MREETLRMERVTYQSQGVTLLDNFCMTIWSGEVLGLVPVNNYGLETLLALLKQNLPLHYGYIYYREKLVNEWRHPRNDINRISVIQNKSCLAEDLTVADNIFVLRPGFKKWFMQPELLKRQLIPFMEDIGVNIKSDAYIEELTTFEKFVVELLKAVVAGNRLIVLENIGTFISDSELVQLQKILRHYAEKGISFLYISAHLEETRLFCDRIALMENGHIMKCFSKDSKVPDTLYLPCVEDYDRWVRQQFDGQDERKTEAAFEVKDLYYGSMQNLNFSIHAGECVVIQDMDNSVLGNLFSLLEGEKPLSGQILVNGKNVKLGKDRSVAVIQELPTESMIFYNMSYVDNLCFNMDHRFNKIWITNGIKRSIMREYGELLGKEVFNKKIYELTSKQKYDLVYTRILLQNPKVVFCIQPFRRAEVSVRSHIWELLERYLEKGIAVVILAVNLADSLALADRLIRVNRGMVQTIYNKEEFINLPSDTPWLYLYQEKYALKMSEKEK